MKLTEKVIGAAAISLLVYEGYTLVNKDKDDTISEAFWKMAPKRPLIPFALGFLMGHFFWQKAAEDVIEDVEKAAVT